MKKKKKRNNNLLITGNLLFYSLLGIFFFFSPLLFIEKWVRAGTSCSVEVDCRVGIVRAFIIV